MNKRIVFLFYHGLGHIIAFSKVARILEAAGYEVYFAGAGFFQKYISIQGSKFYLLKTYPFGLGLETWINTIEKRKYVYFRSLRDRVTDRVYKDREVELYWMLEELKPSMVLVDALLATDFIIMYDQLKKRNIALAMLNTMLPFRLVARRPPLNSDLFPTNEPTMRKAIRKMKWEQLKKTWKKKLYYFGFDDRYLIRRRLIKNNIPRQYISNASDLSNFSVDHVKEIILAPREFDFPDFIPRHDQVYAGFMTDAVRSDDTDANYKTIFTDIFSHRASKNLKLVYCAFGTIKPKKKNIISSFLKKLIPIAINENHILIISLKSKPEDVSDLPTASNVHIFNTVPQLEVLKHADLFITHGGLNSIKEAVYAEVPMLIYPIHPEYDPKGNAARIVYHGLGLRGNAAVEPAEEIEQKIKELLLNPRYKRNIKELKQKDALYTGDRFLEIINSIQPL